MSLYYEVALAIDARDVDVLIKDINKIGGYKEYLEETPDDTYVIYHWDYIQWDSDDVESLLRKLESMRHALVTISEDFEIWRDIETSDQWGTDEQFYELLDITAKIKIWGDSETLEDKHESPIRQVYNIEWAVDDEKDMSFLPEKVFIPGDVEEDDIADYLSDRYGFLVVAYRVEEVTK